MITTLALVFATQIGLVGELTANGHVIAQNDWFAALPSRRALEQTVKACTDTRCVFVPVWDVGPWNTKDDYWNRKRQTWTDLPQGKPQAQAAYQDKYNGGKDEFGRRVLNPAGIDLADGTFIDGLKLQDNAWVNVTYFIDGPGEVDTDGGFLRIRGGPGRSHADVGGAGDTAKLPIECQAKGELIGKTDLWDRIGAGQYVSHAYVKVPAGWTAPECA